VAPEIAIVVTAYNEADRLGETLSALRATFPDARLIVADDASTDATAEVARAGDAEVVSARRRLGKGGVATLAAERARGEGRPILLICDGDLGDSARHLLRLVEDVRFGGGELAVGAFQSSVGGGFGLAVGFARWAIRSLTGLDLTAPISGQRALAPPVLDAVLPFAPRFGMEIGMTVDAHRAGFLVVEVELPLEHRATGRSAAGFLHRARQLKDFLGVYALRRMRGGAR
jgi:glycosyltransferase involved in cell wall biosynthesis